MFVPKKTSATEAKIHAVRTAARRCVDRVAFAGDVGVAILDGFSGCMGLCDDRWRFETMVWRR